MKKTLGCNESVIVMSAVRFMVGRQSYGVGCVIDYLKFNKDRLSESNINVITRDIKEYFERCPDDKTKNEWFNLIQFLNK